MRSQYVAREVRRRLPLEVASRVGVTAGLTNGVGIVESAIEVRDGGVAVGWQLQGEQFRLFMVLRAEGMSGRTLDHRHRRETFARESGSWFNFEVLREITGIEAEARPAATGAGLGFNKYDPDFVYRYLPSPGITVGQVIDAGVAYSQAVAAYR